MTDYLKIGRASELTGRDYRFYRFLESLPGILSLGTLLILTILAYFQPTWVAYFMIAFDTYWLIQVLYMAIYLIASYRNVQRNNKIDWKESCSLLNQNTPKLPDDCLAKKGIIWSDLYQLIILPTYNEDIEIIQTALSSIKKSTWPKEHLIVVLAMEERAGEAARERAQKIKAEYADSFGNFIITFHPDGIVGEIKGKGSNQAWAGRRVKEEIIDPQKIPYDKILVSVFDIDTIISPDYFFLLTHKFLTVSRPYRASYQPVPLYHNNIWSAPFFSRVSAASNTFWQMMMQVRQDKLVTYSSHSMTWQALIDIDFWSPKMVSEDSRIFFHCLMYYAGDYRTEPLYTTISMDITADKDFKSTALSLYKQQRRWAWGAENVAYLVFNYFKLPKATLQRRKVFKQIWIQLYGFHSWGTSALIIGVIGWLPVLLGGARFNGTVLSGNLPAVTSFLMNLAMVGMVLSAVVSSLLLPKRPKGYSRWKKVILVAEWAFVPINIIVFGAIPCLDAQIRLMLGKYMGFWVTPKNRLKEEDGEMKENLLS